ncbi:MAG: 1-deoxy-D-xylulose-5-phosphate synthase [Eubacteriales bacterium]|nr:1-deoxy-D-xylulose-5-phosphate synthase [Eubacteriales bacterium]
MGRILDNIQSPENIKKLSIQQLEQLAEEIRAFLVENISNTGGHLASNLGVVELTLALHKVFDFDKDRLVWDVGHQSYVHKIITGRKDKFSTLRCYKGLSGFPKTDESIYDSFNTGHSSTSISAALGMAVARDINGDDYNVVAVIGDGSLSGGMAYEALDHAGHTQTKMIVILNDNEMSIGKNVGSVARYLSNIRSKSSYFKTKTRTEKIIHSIPFIGKYLVYAIKGLKEGIKEIFIQGRFFEALGFNYIGPVDGSDIATIIEMLNNIKQLDKPVLLHVYTKKGKGYSFAEDNPDKFHGIGNFCIETGECQSSSSKVDNSKLFGKHLSCKADTNKKIVAITAAMPQGTGLSEFEKKHRDRFFDVGIAEQHLVTFSAGLAMKGMVPVIGVYSTFLQRAYDQVLHDVCLQKLHVVFCLDRAGISGNDGETHHGIYDMAFLSEMPNMSILAPSSPKMLCEMMDYAIDEHTMPIAIRYPKAMKEDNSTTFVYGKAEVVKEGNDITVISVGDMLPFVRRAVDIVGDKVSVEIIDLRTVKPLDEIAVKASASKTKKVLVIENHSQSGAGRLVSGVLEDCHIECAGFPIDNVPCHGDNMSLFKEFGLDPEGIAQHILKITEK